MSSAVTVGLVAGIAVLVLIGIGALMARRARDLEPRIDPFALREPWRFFVSDALGAREQLRDALGAAEPGPLRDRLEEIGDRIDDAVRSCWEVAQRGQALTDARRRIEDPRHRSAASQPDAHTRLTTRETEVREHLQHLDAQLDEAVVRAAELTTRPGDPTGIDDVAAQVDTVVDELESLRIAFEELGEAR